LSYLTRIAIDKTQAARHHFVDGYAWHQALWRAFPGCDGAPREFLFRVDDAARHFRVLLLSPELPVLQQWGRWETKRVADTFLEHDSYRFQLKANPTMRRSSDRRRLAIYQEDRLREWLERKAMDSGFEPIENTLVVGAPTDETFVRNGRRGKHVAVDFAGALRVTGREAFRDAFTKGIGSAKAFGFGLLMLQPVS
jgi:CRISPR system Cascade subunit CasE